MLHLLKFYHVESKIVCSIKLIEFFFLWRTKGAIIAGWSESHWLNWSHWRHSLETLFKIFWTEILHKRVLLQKYLQYGLYERKATLLKSIWMCYNNSNEGCSRIEKLKMMNNCIFLSSSKNCLKWPLWGDQNHLKRRICLGSGTKTICLIWESTTHKHFTV